MQAELQHGFAESQVVEVLESKEGLREELREFERECRERLVSGPVTYWVLVQGVGVAVPVAVSLGVMCRSTCIRAGSRFVVCSIC